MDAQHNSIDLHSKPAPRKARRKDGKDVGAQPDSAPMDARNLNDSDSKPAAKRFRQNELVTRPNATTTTNHSDRQASSHGGLDEDPCPTVAEVRVLERLSGEQEATLQRELALRLIHQQNASHLLHQLSLPFADSTASLRLLGVARGLPIARDLPIQQLMPTTQSMLNFGLTPQIGSLVSYPSMLLPQLATPGLSSVPSLPPAAINPIGQNLDGVRGSVPNVWAAVQLLQQQPTMADLLNTDTRAAATATELHNDQKAPPSTAAAASLPRKRDSEGTERSPQGDRTTASAPLLRVFSMSLDSDENSISKYQCILRKQIEFFEASKVDIRARAQGRNVPISVKQIGIRCIHCANIPAGHRPKGAVYFPAKLASLYQSAQNMANNHFNGSSCKGIPQSTLQELHELRAKKPGNLSGGGQRYWIQTAQELGVVDAPETGLVYNDPATSGTDIKKTAGKA